MKLAAIKTNKDFRTAYYRGKSQVHPALVTYVRKNRQRVTRMGITTGKKLGTAVPAQPLPPGDPGGLPPAGPRGAPRLGPGFCGQGPHIDGQKHRNPQNHGKTPEKDGGTAGMKRLLIGLIRVYQRGISSRTGPTCRFLPTCSAYAIEAIQRFGALKGSGLAIWRILRCNPWGRPWIRPCPGEKAPAKIKRIPDGPIG